MKSCPIENTLQYVGRKWSINIIRDLFMGKKRFKEFLASNKELSTKMLSARLKDLEKNDIIEKKVVDMSPITIEYQLTKKGKALNKVLYELAVFSVQEFKKDVAGTLETNKCIKECADVFL